jgi:hypothetical protein
MAKRKPQIRIRSYGIYTQWESKSKDLPRISEFTTDVPAVVDIEFGFVVNIQGAKNQELDYCIHHPGIIGKDGNVREPFDGVVYVKTNDWNFYLGDTIWEPLSDKLGDWRMTLEMDGKLVAEKTFHVRLND